ncbi:MAG: hypothetical protein KC620_20310 [Myxococcales bacterium]|nr:hypothetical protein [Myxococcales bacterium]
MSARAATRRGRLAFCALALGLGACGGPPSFGSLAECRARHAPSPDDGLPGCIKTDAGVMPIEPTYIAGVVQCELAGLTDAGAALEAQAVAARTYLAGHLERKGDDARVRTSPRFQCWKNPTHARSLDAAQQTAGVVLRYDGALIGANYVAGARSLTIDCLPKSPSVNGYDYPTWAAMRRVYQQHRRAGKRIPFGGVSWTEVVVTRNEGRRGADVAPTPMAGRVASNRGAFGQHAAVCLAENLGYETADILRFFYGDDIEFSRPLAPVDPEGEGVASISNTVATE